MTTFPENFRPGRYDVIFGRGRESHSHVGNLFFRELVHKCLPEYSRATTKGEKTAILHRVVKDVLTVGGHFIRRDYRAERWCKVNEFLAKEKTSQYFRDALQDQYKSSNEYKKRNRRDRAKRNQLMILSSIKNDFKCMFNKIDDGRSDKPLKLSDFSFLPKLMPTQIESSYQMLTGNNEDHRLSPISQSLKWQIEFGLKSQVKEDQALKMSGLNQSQQQIQLIPTLNLNGGNESITNADLEPVPFELIKICPNSHPSFDEEEKKLLEQLVSSPLEIFLPSSL